MGNQKSRQQEPPPPRADTNQDQKLYDRVILYQGTFGGQSIIVPNSHFQGFKDHFIKEGMQEAAAERLANKYRELFVANLKKELRVNTSIIFSDN